MEVNDSTSVVVTEASQVSQARRAAVRHADLLGFDQEDAGRVALVATEIATNLVRHGGGGELVMRLLRGDAAAPPAVELLGLDRGPGMNAARCLADGYSTAGSAGIGLGAVRRASEQFDLYSLPERGTVLLSRIVASGQARNGQGVADTAPAFDAAAVCVPRAGEQVCGDAWACVPTPAGVRVLVADGLGHGPDAAIASSRARELFETAEASLPIVALLERVHLALRPTRGAAVALADLDTGKRLLRYCGVGNIVGLLAGAEGVRHLVSHNGTAGHEARRFQEFTYPCAPDALLIMHSDGLATHWRLGDYPGLPQHPSAVVAGVLYRDFKRGRDDATVVALRRVIGRS